MCQIFCDDPYEGTLGEIAAQLRHDSSSFSWFTDRLPGSISLIEGPSPELPINPADVTWLLQLLRQIDPEDEIRSQTQLLSLNSLPTPDVFERMVKAEKIACKRFEEEKQFLNHPAHDALVSLDAEDLSVILDELNDFQERLRSAYAAEFKWQRLAVEEILRGNAAIVIVGETRQVAVECDGGEWHGAEQYQADRHRQDQLQRCGWEFFRIRSSRFYRNPDEALKPLWEMLELSENAGSDGHQDHNEERDEAHDSEPDRGSAQARAETALDIKVAGEDTDEESPPDDDTCAPPCGDADAGSASEETEKDTAPPKRAPSNRTVEETLAMSSRELGRVICDILEDLQQPSCLKEKLTYYVCRRFAITTHSGPRKKIAKKIGWAVSHLKKIGRLEEYKTRKGNVRVRLLCAAKQGKLWE